MKKIAFEIAVAGQSRDGKVYEVENPKAVVLIVHGMGEYGERYERFVVPKLIDHGLAVITYDQFGHGANPGKKGHHPGYDYLLETIDRCLEESERRFQGVPAIIYGHSMGGNVALSYILTRPDRLVGAVVTSPFLRLSFKPPAWKLTIGRLLAKVLPSLTLANELDASAISRRKEEVEAYLDDPLIHDRVSPAYSIEFMDRGEQLIRQAGQITLPVLLLHGSADRLTDHQASRELSENAGGNVQFTKVEGGYHELHHDLVREEVMGQILSFIDERIENSIEDDQNRD